MKRISGLLVCDDKSWKTVKTWSDSSSTRTVNVEHTYNLTSKGTYCCKLDAVVTKSGTKESVSSTSSNQKY